MYRRLTLLSKKNQKKVFGRGRKDIGLERIGKLLPIYFKWFYNVKGSLVRLLWKLHLAFRLSAILASPGEEPRADL